MKINKAARAHFTQRLMQWHQQHNDRSLPWKEERDPYRIWLSEVILQQTRAQQGIPYYLKFLEAFPEIKDMAAADDDTVFRLWQGLGYYNRCRNMLATARHISHERGGRFPETYEALLELKGIGPYTAAAIASFAFGQPCAVVDGNVYRVLARHFGIETPYDTTEGKRLFQSLATDLLAHDDSAGYNQAIMDLGATVCTPAAPRCADCPLRDTCFALRQQAVAVFPVKQKKQTVRNRYFHYLLLESDDRIWIRKRSGKDIWQDLHEPFLIEAEKPLDASGIRQTAIYRRLPAGEAELVYEGALRQRLTHQLIETRFFSLRLPQPAEIPDSHGSWVDRPALRTLAFPKTLVSFFEKKLYF
jgi:A/G-specific adenine glycosylase